MWKSIPSSDTIIFQQSILNSILCNYNFSYVPDEFRCVITNDVKFNVEVIKKNLDSKVTSTGGEKINWLKIVSLKVLCFIWREMSGRILVVEALSNRGIHIPSTRCHICVRVRSYPCMNL